MGRASQASDAVFLNVPFDQGYESKFVALIATVVAARLVPRCALELPERGEGQLGRIRKLLGDCALSIHDLSRPRRFNMPFELGLAVALHERADHEYILLAASRAQFERALSDLKNVAPLEHHHGARILIARLADSLGAPKPERVEQVYQPLVRALPRLKRDYRVRTIFHKTIFNELKYGALEEAKRLGLFSSTEGSV